MTVTVGFIQPWQSWAQRIGERHVPRNCSFHRIPQLSGLYTPKVGSDGLVPHTKGGETAFLLPPEARIRLYFAFQQGIKMSKILGHEWM